MRLANLDRLDNASLLRLAALYGIDPNGVPVWKPMTRDDGTPHPQQVALDSKADVIGFGGAAGGGKAIDVHTRVPTPAGWTTMGALRVGDVVFDETGAPCNVTVVSDVSHRPCYRLTFDDGSVLVADDVHRWVTFTETDRNALLRRSPEFKARRRAARPSRTSGNKSAAFTASLAARNAARALAHESEPVTGAMRSTEELFATQRSKRGAVNHAIRLAGALQTPDAELPIDPYVLGVWLGDGTAACGSITKPDAELRDLIAARGFECGPWHADGKRYNVVGLSERLADIGLRGNKHVPAAYLRGSASQRLELLRGLMDTDGTCATDGGCSFDSTIEQIARSAFELAASLGCKPTIREYRAKLEGRDYGPAWRVSWTSTLPVFHLSRKAERLPATLRLTQQFRYINSIEPVESVPTVCIAVDSPTRQYLVGEGMIPTHNTDLAIGKALTRHFKTLFLRREATQLQGVIDRIGEILGTTDGYTMRPHMWRLDGGRQVEFGSTPAADDWTKYQGRPHDLLVFEEAANFLKIQVQSLMTWLRSTDPRVERCQALLTFNPPTSSDGQWIVDYFAPWIDPQYKGKRAEPGELRWFVEVPTDNDGSKTVEVDGPAPVMIDGERYNPQSRTFIRAVVQDNTYLMDTKYLDMLRSLPEPLRSQMLRGDFSVGLKDDVQQVIPSAWLDAAMARWVDQVPVPRMTSIGVDVARGGPDQTVIARRHGWWFAKPIVFPGTATPDGAIVGGHVIANRRDRCPIGVDGIGVGGSVVDFLRQQGVADTMSIIVSQATDRTIKGGALGFNNLRAAQWWAMREALDPANNTGIALPPDAALRGDLLSARWFVRRMQIVVESREEIIGRIGRSPDTAAAYLNALDVNGPPVGVLVDKWAGADDRDGRPVRRDDYNPHDRARSPRREHNPYQEN